MANDHFVFTGKKDDDRQTLIGQQFAGQHDIRKPYYATPGDGIFHFYFPEQGLVVPGQFIPGADSHSRAYGAYGAVGMGVGSTTLGFGWSTGYIYFTMPKQRRVRFTGTLRPWVTGKDIVLELLRRWGAKQSQGMSVELVDVARQLPIAYRNTIANMMAEAEALNGIFAPDEITYAWYRAKGMTTLPYPRIACGADAVFDLDEELALGDVTAMIAKPFSPGNAFAAEEVARERITFDKAMIGSCTNGSYDDLLSAALVLVAARGKGLTRAVKELVVFPGSGGVKQQIERPDAAPRRRIDRRRLSIGRGRDPSILVWTVLRPGTGCAGTGTACHHVVQPQLAEPHGARRRRFSCKPLGRGRFRSDRLHGPTDGARPRVGSGQVRALTRCEGGTHDWHARPALGDDADACIRIRRLAPRADGPHHQVHRHQAGERAARDHLRGSQRPGVLDRRPLHGRFARRAQGPHRFRASLRAHDVQGIREYRARRALHAGVQQRRHHERHHQQGPHALLRDAARQSAGPRHLSRGRSHALARHHERQPRQPAERRAGRAPARRRQPALRQDLRDRRRPRLRQSGVRALRHRIDGGFERRLRRRRGVVLQDLLRAQQRRARDRRRCRLQGHAREGAESVRVDSVTAAAASSRHDRAEADSGTPSHARRRAGAAAAHRYRLQGAAASDRG